MERQDYILLSHILEYRALKSAKDAFNGKDLGAGFGYLSKNPALLDLMGEMLRAQIPVPEELTDSDVGKRLAESWQQEATSQESD